VTPRSILLRPILVRTILVFLLALVAFTFKKTTVEASPVLDPPAFLYTVTTHYEPLAWMHGGDRFSSSATIFVRDASGKHPLVPGFAASADSSVSFDGQRILFAGKLKAQDPWQIWEAPLAGGKPRQITSGGEDCIRPFYLPEDRVVYARRTAGRFVIETVELAGGRPLPLTYGPASFLPTDILRDGRILFEASSPLGTEAVPEIYTVYSDGSGVESYRCDHGEGRHSGRQVSSGDIVFSSSQGLARFTSARAQQVHISAPVGEYAGEVAETFSGDWLLAWHEKAKAHFQLMLWTPGSWDLRPAEAEQDADAVQPVFIAERSVPNRHPSGLHDWPNANLLCLNAYTSKYKFAAGSIHSVRFYTRDDVGNPRLLGTAPVERDGSFFVQVPTEKPLQLELLDGEGKTLQREAGFFWMRRGEQRACVGCHAGPETSPDNAVPMILLKSTTPADMTGATAQNASGGH
jgi:Hydrazine synthase alpha subunit middle domain